MLIPCILWPPPPSSPLFFFLLNFFAHLFCLPRYFSLPFFFTMSSSSPSHFSVRSLIRPKLLTLSFIHSSILVLSQWHPRSTDAPGETYTYNTVVRSSTRTRTQYNIYFISTHIIQRSRKAVAAIAHEKLKKKARKRTTFAKRAGNGKPKKKHRHSDKTAATASH